MPQLRKIDGINTEVLVEKQVKEGYLLHGKDSSGKYIEVVVDFKSYRRFKQGDTLLVK